MSNEWDLWGLTYAENNAEAIEKVKNQIPEGYKIDAVYFNTDEHGKIYQVTTRKKTHSNKKKKVVKKRK